MERRAITIQKISRIYLSLLLASLQGCRLLQRQQTSKNKQKDSIQRINCLSN